MKAGSTAMTPGQRDRVLSGSMLALPGPKRPDRANPPKNVWWSLFFHALGFHWTDCQQGILCWGLGEFGRGQHSSNRPSGISTRRMHQSITPSLSQTIWPRWASKHFLTLPIVQILLPVTFAYSLSPEAVVIRELRRWKRLWWRSLTRSHKRTSIGPSRSCWNGITSVLQPV